MKDTVEEEVQELVGGLSAKVADAERRAVASESARAAAERRTAAFEAAVAAGNMETWTIARGVVVDDTEGHRIEPRAVAFGPLTLVRRHVGYILLRDRLPWDGDNLEARLSDEECFEIGVCGRKVFACLNKDGADTLVAWLGGAAKPKGKL